MQFLESFAEGDNLIKLIFCNTGLNFRKDLLCGIVGSKNSEFKTQGLGISLGYGLFFGKKQFLRF